jgi:hypothetical protein
MTREEYREHPALNFSLAKHLLTSPAHFKAAVDEEQKETTAMLVGTMAHSMILEGKDLRDLYAIKPKGMSFANKEGKAWRDAQTLPIITEDDSNSIPAMADAISKNPDAATILRGCEHVERPIFFSMYGVECKALIDLCGQKEGRWAMGDLKTTNDASPRKFSSAAFDRHYDMQLAWSCDGLAMAEGLESEPWAFWLAIETSAPWVNAVYEPSAELMASGRRKMERALTIYKQCMETGEWPMPKWATVIEIPGYAKFKQEEQP